MSKAPKTQKECEALFRKAEDAAESFFSKIDINVPKGTINISGELYILIRSSSLSVDFFDSISNLYRDKEQDETLNVVRQLLFDLGYTIGMKDAEFFQNEIHLLDPREKLAMGIHYSAHTGWGLTKISKGSNFTPNENFTIVYNKPNSVEAMAWQKNGRKAEMPICFMSSGYMTGWCGQSLGIPIVATELTCKAKGDKQCHFIMAHPSHIQKYIDHYLKQVPRIGEKTINYKVLGFSGINRKEVSIKEANAKLLISNQQLIQKLKVLEEKAYIGELLSELEELLQSCGTNTELYSVFSHYITKIFPHYNNKLWVYNDDKKFLQGVSVGKKSIVLDEHIFPPNQCWAIRRGKKHVILSSSRGARCEHIQDDEGGCICLPLAAGGESFGLLSIMFGTADFSKDEEKLAARLAADLARALANVRLRDSLRELSIRDYLTGLYNRRYMQDMLNNEITKAKRNRTILSVIMFDIDNFKKFNDLYGHDAGDAILSNLGKTLRDHFREGDIICRFGGEEFLIVLTDTSEAIALEKAEILRQNIKKLQTKFENQIFEQISISIGVALYPTHGTFAKSLLNAADRALYRAKNEGRDRICLAVGESHSSIV